MPRPVKSPELNPFELVWGILARRVYANAENVCSGELRVDCILHKWELLALSNLVQLAESMEKRCVDVSMNHGKKNTTDCSHAAFRTDKT